MEVEEYGKEEKIADMEADQYREDKDGEVK